MFGGRQPTTVPLVSQARDWNHGVFMGATMASETTAAAEGAVGRLRHDPFAMLPFCGYDIADYFAHWLEIGEALGAEAPPVFSVNWFRKDEDGRFLWPGFSENARVLEWVVRRIEGDVEAVDTPVGKLPRVRDFNVAGLDLGYEDLQAILSVDREAWSREADEIERYFGEIGGERIPASLQRELSTLRANIR
ncbi:phosphoenolpyruvate carboxykinase (GTP) [Herbiconiux moechotypicola]|nr:phosphoenolpyruvate carboxykinase (GTP) [Herbiconiux moechotypicola]